MIFSSEEFMHSILSMEYKWEKDTENISGKLWRNIKKFFVLQKKGRKFCSSWKSKKKKINEKWKVVWSMWIEMKIRRAKKYQIKFAFYVVHEVWID